MTVLMKGGFSIEGLLVNNEENGWGIMLEEGNHASFVPLDRFFKLVRTNNWVKLSIKLNHTTTIDE